VVLHPQFAGNRLVYLSYAEPAATAPAARRWRGRNCSCPLPATAAACPICRCFGGRRPRSPAKATTATASPSTPAGKLWISSGDRQKLEPAQDLQSNLGKILRLNDDGSVPSDNPFAAQGGEAAKIWSYGHRNVLGLAFDAQGGCGSTRWVRPAAMN
jgi:glucose/arabinose dehydrogenase